MARDCKKSEAVRKVRLKTASGVMTLCYRSSQSSGQENSSPDASSSDKASREDGHVPGAEESGFGSLPELVDFQDRSSIAEGSFSYLSPDFSTYKFWASEWCRGLSHGAGLLDTFPSCDLAVNLDDAPGLESVVVAQGPDDLQNFAIQPDPLSQNSMTSSCVEDEITNRQRLWGCPLELEEDMFECTTYSNMLKEVNEGELHEVTMVENYLVDTSPQLSDVVTDVENLDSNLLVYAPNRYLEDACIFQSSPAEMKNSVMETVGRDRILDSPKDSVRKKRRLRDNWTDDGQGINIGGKDSAPASCIEGSDVENVSAKKPISGTGEAAHVPLHILHFLNHRRRRFSAPGLKRSKFHEPTSLDSLDRRSPSKSNREIKPGLPGRSPIRKSGSTRRLLPTGYCSNSSSGESDRDRHKSPPGKTFGQSPMPVVCGTKQARRRAEISLKGPASPLKEITNRSSDRGANPSLLRKKRTRYKDVYERPDTAKIETRLDTGTHSHDTPQNSKISRASGPCHSPTIAQFRRSPWDNRKKVRTIRRRPQSSPASAKQLHFYGNIIHRGSNEVVHAPPSLAEREIVHRGTESLQRKRRKRLPLPQASVETLQMWLQENLSDPYPSRQEKEELVLQTGLKMSQIDNWLGNARQKLKFKSRAVKDLCSESSSSPRKTEKRNRLFPLTVQI